MGPQLLNKIWPNYVAELEEKEIQEFYMNMMHLLMVPYQGRTGSFIYKILERVLPTALQSTKLVPLLFDGLTERKPSRPAGLLLLKSNKQITGHFYVL
jgi:hypothetical protein